MKLSAFTMVRNADKYYFPIKESILSVLPIVDEFIVALGDCDDDDNTRELIDSIGSDKIKVFNRKWSEKDFIDGRVFAKETDFALSKCQGDWCLYLQADEVLHESDLEWVVKNCEECLKDIGVEGFLFSYYHFYGDYKHHLDGHGWYKNEIRIIRNGVGVYSHKDAQSFRRKGNKKLNVIELDVPVYHYGWVRPPEIMQSKRKEQVSMHHGKEKAQIAYESKPEIFEYGPLGKLSIFDDAHPAVMEGFISKLNWRDKLNYSNKKKSSRSKLKHEKIKNRFLSFFEKKLNGGKDFFGYKNWKIIKKNKRADG